MAKHPGAALFANILSYASKHGRRPSMVYRDYCRHPRDYRLVFAYDSFVAEQQQREIKDAQANARQRSRR